MNYKKVIEDYNNGTINPKLWRLIMDNDGGYWSYTGSALTDLGMEEAESRMEEEYGTPDGYRDIVDVLEAAGVNCDWC